MKKKKRVGFLIDVDLLDVIDEIASKNKINRTQFFIQICLKIKKGELKLKNVVL